MSDQHLDNPRDDLEIAVVGMAGRFPGASDLDTFWRNLRDGIESISFFTDAELEARGVDPAALRAPHFVKAAPVLEGVDLFDASFFGYAPREAEIIDPQHRIFLECAWEALEYTGYDPTSYEGLIGVYTGTSLSAYLLFNLLAQPAIRDAEDTFEVMVGNDKDFLSTRVSYNLNLKGPSVDVQTGCSTSLVAVHLACQSLLSYQCDLALAGGISVNVPQRSGYYAQAGGIASPDGHCRAFDARGQGTIFGSGVGVVVLKRLEDALADGDTIHALIKGSAINNDGAVKVGFTAPSVAGQAEVIARSQAVAEVAPETIGYVETHGTGTALGDPVEVAALTQAFRAGTDAKGFCAIGSVKTNIGHLDAAAGIAGLIKTILALEHRQIPPSLHFERPNPQIDFASSPFYVNTTLTPWASGAAARRAGVSSFGIGGTNAHVILEEAPRAGMSDAPQPWQLLLISAKTSSALDAATVKLADHLRQRADSNLADIAYTLQTGRKRFSYRRILVCQDRDDAIAALEARTAGRVLTVCEELTERPVVFMFPGGGAQYVDMGRDLYETEPVFRQCVNQCLDVLRPQLGYDLRALLYPSEERAAAERMKETSVALPALFVIEYALAQLWISWGVGPQALIGHSLGEYVAACLAGVFTLEDALALVVRRGRLFEQVPSGRMLSIPLSADEVRPLLTERTSLAAINSPSQCVVSGPTDAIERLAARLLDHDVEFRRLQIDVAAHSELITPIIEPFTRFVASLPLRAPQMPFISNVSGTWITATQATDPQYWGQHLRQTVQFSDGIRELLREPTRLLLEVGPGQTLTTLARLHTDSVRAQTALPSMRHPYECQSDRAVLLATVGKLWMLGAQIDWGGLHRHETRRRLPLPTYPFERQRYWVAPDARAIARASAARSGKTPDIADWSYIPSWKRSPPPRPFRAEDLAGEPRRWLIFEDTCGLGADLARSLEAAGQNVVTVRPGERFASRGDRAYTLDLRRHEGYARLLEQLRRSDWMPGMIIHLWSVTPDDQQRCGPACFQQAQEAGFYSLLWLAQALGSVGKTDPLHLWVVANHVQPVESRDLIAPEKATIIGAVQVIPQEYPHITCHFVDVVVPGWGGHVEPLAQQLLAEMSAPSADLIVAYRDKQRLVQAFEPAPLEGTAIPVRPLRKNGVYLITGGTGTIGLLLAEYLARHVGASVILVGRSAFPPRGEWAAWLASHDPADRRSHAIRGIQAIEGSGTEILLMSADVADAGQMRAVFDEAYARFGAIHGVIHAAGIAGEQAIRLISDIDQHDYEAAFQAKVYGLYVLNDLLRGKALDFCMLFSSNAAILGGLGSACYSAANLFMDAFAAGCHRDQDPPWISANWDGWLPEGADRLVQSMQTSLDRYAMTAQEGIEAFRRIATAATVGQVVVSTGDLDGRIDLWIRRNGLHRPNPVDGHAAPGSLHPRPALGTDYAPPSNELQQTIIRIWQELLGIEQLGINDNFFDLGGNSLIGLKIIARLNQELGTDIAIVKLFEGPTASALAAVIAQDSDATPDFEASYSRGERRRERRRKKD